MTAKTYYARLKECATEDAFNEVCNQIFSDLVKDVDDLIFRRNAKKNSAILSCINEVNQKYHALVRLHRAKVCELPDDSFIKQFDFSEDGFKAIFVHERPQYSWAFDLEAHVKNVEEYNKRAEEQRARASSYFPHMVIPFNELTMDNIYGEVLNCSASLGGLAEAVGPDMAATMGAPLAYRISLLRHWIRMGRIDLNEAREWEKDPAAWAKEHF